MTSPHTYLDIRFSNLHTQLAGTLSYPHTTGPFSAIIMLHGSGPSDRTNGGYFPPIQQFFLSQGFAVLCYDKPGVGQSTGDWKKQSFEDRAQEALAAIKFLQDNPKINSDKIGLWGHSQGAWIVFLAAAMSNDIAFVIANSGSGVSPYEQDQFGIEQTSRAEGEPESEIEQALMQYKALVKATHQNESYEEIARLLNNMSSDLLQRYLNLDQESWKFWKQVVDYDPIPAFQNTKCSVLALFGGQDLLVPVEESMAIYEQELINAATVDIFLFPEGKHRITDEDTGSTGPGYFETIGNWLKKMNG
ncbi:MAG: alpha/beta fold hydrolase [Chloroflexota bacterium]